jgi:hypothetical protein
MASFDLGWRLGPLDSHLEGVCVFVGGAGGWGGGEDGVPLEQYLASLSLVCVGGGGWGRRGGFPLHQSLALLFFSLFLSFFLV